mgnify:CR=1 FL=1
MAQTNVYVKNFESREAAMAFKYQNKLPVHIYDGDQWKFMNIDEEFQGEALPLESLDTSLLVEDTLNPRHCKLYRFMDVTNCNEYDAPRQHNYVLGLNTKLFPKRKFVQGELQTIHWYSDIEKEDLVLKVIIEYTRDGLGFATTRKTTRTWIREDGSEHEWTKVSIKEYDMLAQINEGVRRRGNIVKGIQMPVLGMMMQTIQDKSSTEVILMGRDFLKKYQSDFVAFQNDSNAGIITEITNATEEWLDNPIGGGATIRTYIINELDIYS